MKDRDKIANMLQNQIMELVKSLNDIGYNFKLTHNGIASEIRKKPIYKDDEKLASQLDKVWSIKHEGYLNPNNIIFRDKKYIEFSKMLKEENDKLGSK